MSPAHKAFFPPVFQSFGPLVWTTDEDAHSTWVCGGSQEKTGEVAETEIKTEIFFGD
jgi:hypothetical protein